MQPSNYITAYTIGSHFSEYPSKTFEKLDENCSFLPWYNYKYSGGKDKSLQFMEYRIERMYVLVEHDIIKEMSISLEIIDIDTFYKELETIYGKIRTAGLSKAYLQKNGLNPLNTDLDSHNSHFKNLPPLKITDYKDMDRVAWYGLSSNMETGRLSMVVRNKLLYEIMNQKTYSVEINFIHREE